MFTNKTYTNDDKICRMGILSVLLTPKSQMRLGARGAWVGATAVAPRGVRTPDWPTQAVTQPRKKWIALSSLNWKEVNTVWLNNKFQTKHALS